MNRLNDKWFRLIGIPLSALMANIIFYFDMNEKHGFSFVKDYLYTLATVFILWEVNRQVILYTRRRFSSFEDSKKRMIQTATLVVLATVGIMTLISFFYDVTGWWGYDYKLENYLYNNFAALTYVIIVSGMYEASYYFRKWRTVEVEAALLKKENLQSQLDSLKQQISPHFLFNTLNTLSSLIRKDADRAELFLDELSKVYRYLLRNNEDELIELGTELQFMESYFHLLLTRYGNAVQLCVNVAQPALSLFLPPLTLQLLVENAVKHNIIEKRTPLLITIAADNRKLIVTNNLQLKTVSMLSNGIGLSNIRAKYKLLSQSDIIVTQNENSFIVQVPLIKRKEYDIADC